MTNNDTLKGERIVTLETKFDNMERKLEEHCKNNKDAFDKVMSKLESLDKHMRMQQKEFGVKLDSMHSLFAGKWVEYIIKGILVTFIAGLIITLVVYIITGQVKL